MLPQRLNGFGVVYAAIIGSATVLLVLSIPYGTYAVFFTHLSSTYSPSTRVGYLPIYVALVTLEIPITPTFGALFVGLTAIYIACLVLAAVQGGGFVRALVTSGRDGIGAILRNPLSATVMILGATLLATVILDSIQTSAGVQTGGISGDPFLLLMDLTLSPLIEEVGYRFFLIGVPLFALVLLLRQSDGGTALRTLWRPSAAWDPPIPAVQSATGQGLEERGLGVSPSTLKNFTYFLIAFSSILFGLAHYLSGAGWDIGKVSEAALDGVALGYLYVRYGLHASIIFHWGVDFASNAFAFYGQGVFGISWTSNSLYSLLPTYDILVVVGLPGLLYIANLLLKRVISPKAGPTADDSSRQVYTDTTGGDVQGNLANDT